MFVVSQETYLFNGTIRDNLRYAAPDATEEEMIDAFRKANKTHLAIHPVLVTTYGLANNQYSSIFQNVVTLKDLFK